MLDINFIRQNPEIVRKAVKDKYLDVDIDELLAIDQKRREILSRVDELRHARKQAADDRNIETGKEIKRELETWEIELTEAEERFKHLMMFVPNISYPDAPVGANSDANKIIKQWGEKPKFKFETKDHIQLGKQLDIIDLEAGSKVSGFRGYFLKNSGAILHLAVLNYAFDKIMASGFMPMVPPTLVHGNVLTGSGHFPFGKDNIYQIANPGKLETGEEVRNPLYLTGTSEPSLLAYYADKVIDEAELPIKVCAMTHCYRSEVGDYGKDTRGVYRVHEFDKVEQVVICKNDINESQNWFAKTQQLTESIIQELGISYQVVETSTGDMGAGKYRMTDIEIWMPSREKFGEICSNSDLTDWQMRRSNIKFRSKDGKLYHPYALNCTVVASPRILIAILENHQQADGSIKIPEVLQPYTNFSEIKNKSKA